MSVFQDTIRAPSTRPVGDRGRGRDQRSTSRWPTRWRRGQHPPGRGPRHRRDRQRSFAQLLHGVQVAAGQTVAGTPVVAVSLSYGFAESEHRQPATWTAQDKTYLAARGGDQRRRDRLDRRRLEPPVPGHLAQRHRRRRHQPLPLLGPGRLRLRDRLGGAYRHSAGAGGGGQRRLRGPDLPVRQRREPGTKRNIPDVSLVADPYTGVSVYDSFDNRRRQPLDPDRRDQRRHADVRRDPRAGPAAAVAAGKTLLTSTQIDTALYPAYNPTTYADLFQDVTLGKNSDLSSSSAVTVAGFTATTGYDLATGLGSPIANTMVPYLAAYKP